MRSLKPKTWETTESWKTTENDIYARVKDYITQERQLNFESIYEVSVTFSWCMVTTRVFAFWPRFKQIRQ